MAATVGALRGVKNMMRNLNKEILKIKGRSMKGLIEAAIVIRRDMDKTPPLIPVDTGNLRASSFITTHQGAIESAANFRGPNAGEMSGDHREAIAKVQSSARAYMKGPVVGMGFSASYAEPVHESKAGKNWNRESSGPKFFEKALKRNEQVIVDIVRANAKII